MTESEGFARSMPLIGVTGSRDIYTRFIAKSNQLDAYQIERKPETQVFPQALAHSRCNGRATQWYSIVRSNFQSSV